MDLDVAVVEPLESDPDGAVPGLLLGLGHRGGRASGGTSDPTSRNGRSGPQGGNRTPVVGLGTRSGFFKAALNGICPNIISF